MTHFSSKKGNKNLSHNMDVTHALLYAEISMEETVKRKKKRQTVKKEDAKTKYASS